MKFSNPEKAVISIEKLKDYCLNEEHPIGKHKAKVFKKALNMDKTEAETLRQIILKGIYENEAFETGKDMYGSRYYVDIDIQRKDKFASIRTLWIIKFTESFPRLTSCYIKTNKI